LTHFAIITVSALLRGRHLSAAGGRGVQMTHPGSCRGAF
jgi:hypothetical protein